jgi:hypothetical protein
VSAGIQKAQTPLVVVVVAPPVPSSAPIIQTPTVATTTPVVALPLNPIINFYADSYAVYAYPLNKTMLHWEISEERDATGAYVYGCRFNDVRDGADAPFKVGKGSREVSSGLFILSCKAGGTPAFHPLDTGIFTKSVEILR